MRELVLARRAGVLTVAAAVGALVASPALADAVVSPNTAAQGTGQDFRFHVTNSCATPLQTIKLSLPADAPIAEVYPLSADNWAPKITTIQLKNALPTIHTGVPTTEATGAITWIAMPGKALAPGASTDLSISLGPLPTLSSYQFTLATSLAGGAACQTTPLNVTLNPATQQQLAAEHAGHDEAGGDPTGTTGDDPATAEDQQFKQIADEATRGPSVMSIAGWVLLALVLLGGGGWLMLRGRHRAEEDDEPDEDEVAPKAKTDDEPDEPEEDEDEAKEPVAAGKWSLKE